MVIKTKVEYIEVCRSFSYIVLKAKCMCILTLLRYMTKVSMLVRKTSSSNNSNSKRLFVDQTLTYVWKVRTHAIIIITLVREFSRNNVQIYREQMNNNKKEKKERGKEGQYRLLNSRKTKTQIKTEVKSVRDRDDVCECVHACVWKRGEKNENKLETCIVLYRWERERARANSFWMISPRASADNNII